MSSSLLTSLSELIWLTRSQGYVSARSWAEVRPELSAVGALTDFNRLRSALVRLGIPADQGPAGKLAPGSGENPLANVVVMRCSEGELRRVVKECSRCGKVKRVRSFWRDSTKTETLRNPCIACIRKTRHSYTSKNKRGGIRQVSKYDQSQQPARKANVAKARKRQAIEHPEQLATSQWVRLNVRSGRLIRPTQCEACGESGRVLGKPGDYRPGFRYVRAWLCAVCTRRPIETLGIPDRPSWEAIVAAWGGACAYCSKPVACGVNATRDHVAPISAAFGGEECETVVPACKECNSSKGRRPVDAFLRSRGLNPDTFVARRAQIVASFGRTVPEPVPLTPQRVWVHRIRTEPSPYGRGVVGGLLALRSGLSIGEAARVSKCSTSFLRKAAADESLVIDEDGYVRREAS